MLIVTLERVDVTNNNKPVRRGVNLCDIIGFWDALYSKESLATSHSIIGCIGQLCNSCHEAMGEINFVGKGTSARNCWVIPYSKCRAHSRKRTIGSGPVGTTSVTDDEHKSTSIVEGSNSISLSCADRIPHVCDMVSPSCLVTKPCARKRTEEQKTKVTGGEAHRRSTQGEGPSWETSMSAGLLNEIGGSELYL